MKTSEYWVYYVLDTVLSALYVLTALILKSLWNRKSYLYFTEEKLAHVA